MSEPDERPWNGGCRIRFDSACKHLVPLLWYQVLLKPSLDQLVSACVSMSSRARRRYRALADRTDTVRNAAATRKTTPRPAQHARESHAGSKFENSVCSSPLLSSLSR